MAKIEWQGGKIKEKVKCVRVERKLSEKVEKEVDCEIGERVEWESGGRKW